jgi:hypothetical protein
MHECHNGFELSLKVNKAADGYFFGKLCYLNMYYV